jgi:hypothetical protein
MQRNRVHARPRTALALTSCAVALAACGSTGSKPNATTARYGPASSPGALSRCMRANGASGFPDPIAGPSGAVGLPLTVNSDGSLTAEGKTFAGPAVRSAERACKAYLPSGSPPPKVRAQQLRQQLAFAHCMRAHGVQNFPDPSSSSGQGALPAGINPQSPAFRTAARECGAGGTGHISIGR